MRRVPARTTVVIPCYNDGRFVPGLVDSVREDEPVELIVVDDGSTDAATVLALDELAAAGRIRLLRQPNRGVEAAMSAGVEAASTPYVFFAGADDLLEAGALRRLADALEANPGAAVAYGWLHYFGEVDFLFRTPAWNPWILLHANLWPGCFLVRREVFAEIGGFRRTGYEDWDFYLALAERGHEAADVQALVYHYRRHGGTRINRSVQGRFREHYRDMRRAHAPLFAREPELRRRYPVPLVRRLAYRAQLAVGLLLPPRLAALALLLKLRARGLAGLGRRAGA
jgi:glycosyltransferase involved in cell wall biosynthesis